MAKDYCRQTTAFLTWIKSGQLGPTYAEPFLTKRVSRMYQRIFVATDGSPLSRKAVNAAIDMAVLCGADVVALKVVQRYPISYFEGSVAMAPHEIGLIEKQWTDAAHAVVDSVKETAAKQGIKVKTIVVRSDLIAEAIIAAARKHKCDLLVMASHGRKGIKRVLLGSETLHVLTHSEIPVLVLR
jgi:nucleotide-binding universal stress UspA family protein